MPQEGGISWPAPALAEIVAIPRCASPRRGRFIPGLNLKSPRSLVAPDGERQPWASRKFVSLGASASGRRRQGITAIQNNLLVKSELNCWPDQHGDG